MIREYTYNLQGKELKVTIGKVAKQANGSCLIEIEDSIVLVTAVASTSPRLGIDFFPLSCDFEEKLYSVGKIPGGFIKREGKSSDKAILISRLIDRPIRPLFPDNYRNDVQIIATPLSVDHNNSLEMLSMIGSSIALSISDIPFNGPTAAVKVGYVDNKFIINPNKEQKENSEIELIVAGTKDNITMVEAGCKMMADEKVLEGILFANQEIKKICEFISDIQSEIGKEKLIVEEPEINLELKNRVIENYKDKVINILKETDRHIRQVQLDELINEALEEFVEYEEETSLIKSTIQEMEREEIRRKIVEEKIRPDGRTPEEIRHLTSEISLLPRAHGSGLFTRGETQALSVTTLGAPSDVQMLDSLVAEEKHYMHHYNFPPFSVGDTKPLRGPGRREIGHGALGEKALLPVLPDEEDFPYTIRVVSEVLESNGSSSQASICGSTLSLLDAGVPLKANVAGIAMGLIENPVTKDTVILSDIQGIEDFLGDMDFKIAGTRDSITAIQMDIKIEGVSEELLREALRRARDGRNYILDNMEATISEPKESLSDYAPRLFSLKVDPEKIGLIIGSGGKTINKIIEETGVKIDTYDDGQVVITAENGEMGEKAKSIIENLVKDVEVGQIYEGKVIKIMNFGAFVEILPGKEGLVHISQLDHKRVDKVEDVLSVGDKIMVKVSEIDNKNRINLSRKALLSKE